MHDESAYRLALLSVKSNSKDYWLTRVCRVTDEQRWIKQSIRPRFENTAVTVSLWRLTALLEHLSPNAELPPRPCFSNFISSRCYYRYLTDNF